VHTILILNPGHFHAALVLRESHPDLARDVYVYAEQGADLDRFMHLVTAFNERQERPTDWRFHIYTGSDYRQKLIEERKGDIVVIAGKNDTKMEDIEQLSRAGFFVLADKPWLINEDGLPLLRKALHAERPLALDIMTERFEISTILQRAFMAENEVFGEIRIDADGSPSVFKESIHHLYKIVNNRPLVRPAWYFDIAVQGEGITDVTTHLVDMTHWMLLPGTAIDFNQSIELVQARRWPTRIPLETYAKITQQSAFPETVVQDVNGDSLPYFSNGEIVYRINGVPIHVRVVWNLEIPEGGGDRHQSLIKGTRSDLVVRQLPAHGFKVELLIAPHEDLQGVAQAVQRCLEKWSARYPGLSIHREEDKLLIDIPDDLRTSHEEHFCQVRDMYLAYLVQGAYPPETKTGILAKYTLLAEARKMAMRSPFVPLDGYVF
jgi:predicted dehydrogenase